MSSTKTSKRAGGVLCLELGTGEPDADGNRWHQIGLTGTWKGHAFGEFSLDQKLFDQIKGNFAAKSNDVVVDYDHKSLSFFAKDSKAGGWIKDVEIRSPGKTATLHALIDWTDSAREQIDAKEFRYLSPTFCFDATDPVTGKKVGGVLDSVALTNRPFLDELPEIQQAMLDRLFANHPKVEQTAMNETELKALRVTLGLPDDASVDACIAAAVRPDLKPLAVALGVESAEVPALVGAIETLQAAKVAADTLAEKHATAAASVATLEQQARIDKATKAGKVVEQNRAYVEAIALDAKAFDLWFAAAPAVVKLGKTPPPKTPAVHALNEETATPEQWVAAYNKLPENLKLEARESGCDPAVYVQANFDDFRAQGIC